MRFDLLRHAGVSRSPVARIEIDIARTSPAVIAVHYRLEGDASRIRVPNATVPARADDLWKQTCFELFIRPWGDARYFEFNFSPSRCWAAYAFSDYRQGMTNLDLPAPPRINRAAPTADAFDLDVLLDLSGVSGLPAEAAWRAGIAAVVETVDGEHSWWALAHPPGKPDFHHPDGFIAELPPIPSQPERA
jgi:hypothetical protein